MLMKPPYFSKEKNIMYLDKKENLLTETSLTVPINNNLIYAMVAFSGKPEERQSKTQIRLSIVVSSKKE